MPETTEYTRLGDGGNQSLFSRWQYLTRLEKGLILISTVFGVVIFSLAVALAKCDAQVPPTPSQNVTTVAPETTTVPPSTTTVPPKTTTVPPKTTTVPPSTTTVPPNTTTVPPKTTTVPPKTTTSTTTVPPKTTTSTTTVPPSTTSVPPTPTTITTTSTTTKNSTNEIENTSPENIKQSITESATSPVVNTSENAATKFVKNIPPIPLTGTKQIISLQQDDTLTTINPYEETTEKKNFETVTEKQHPVLSRKKRIDLSSTAEGKQDNPIYE